MRTIYNKLQTKAQYYLCIQRFQFLLISSYLLYILPTYFFMKSNIFKKFTDGLTKKFIIWRYGSIEALDLLSPIEQYNLLKNIFIFFGSMGYFAVFFIAIFCTARVLRTFSVNGYSLKRTGKISDDFGFSHTFVSLVMLFNYPLMLIIKFDLIYQFIAANFTFCFVFYLLVKTNAYGYSLIKND